MTTASLPASLGGRLAWLASRASDRTAIVEGNGRVSFGQLDAAAGAIAHRIQAVCAGRPGAVALLFENRIPAIESIFGAAKSSRAYVPVDAGDPDERLRFILADSESVALLTEGGLLDRARALAPQGCAVIDADRVDTAGASEPLPQVSPDALAIICYTSGSTGQPKGVCQTHRNILFFGRAYAETLGIRETDRHTLLYTLSFSAPMMDIFGGLLSGAMLCAYDVRSSGLAPLADWLDRERITVLHAVPTLFRGLFNSLAPERRLEHLRAIDLGGEAVFDSDVELFRRHTPATCIFVNHLAATEASVTAQHAVGHDSVEVANGVLPVGRPPPGVAVRIRREDGSDAPTGETGRIVVSSAHVSPGYWRRPELNAATFSQDSAEPGRRNYLSTDLGYFDAQGLLHFIGREGSRVKIRGHSVDLSEVEAALSACPGVLRAAILASGGGVDAEAAKLTAYVVVDDRTERSPLSIRHALADRLPPYMLPTAFAFLDALPFTATGKIDRNALAAIAPLSMDRAREADPPRDDLERSVAAMFEELLQEAPVGRGDDFFLLGGDSLSLSELQTQVLQRFGVSLPTMHVDATVAAIAASIAQALARGPGARAPIPVLLQIRESAGGPPLFLVHGRLGQAFVSRHFLSLLPAELPVWALQARGLDGLHEPHSTIDAMAADYVAEVRKQQPHGPYFIAGLCAGALIAGVMARILKAAGEAVLPLLLFDPPGQRFREAVSDESLRARLEFRRTVGQYSTPIEDPHYATAAVKTAKAFELAVRAYEPSPYDGPVYMLSSRQRIHARSQAYWKTVFTGPLQRFEVGATHDAALDPRSPAFAAHLAHCLNVILAIARGQARPSPLPSLAGGPR